MTHLKTLAAVALAVSLFPAGAAVAQDPTAPPRVELMTSTPSPAFDNLDIDFPGGTLREYLRHLQDRAGVNNIVIRSEGIGEIEMPEVKLSGVHFADAIQLVSSLVDSEKHSNLTISPVGTNQSIYVVSVSDLWGGPEGSINALISVDFAGGSLADYVGHIKEISNANKILLRGPADRFEIDTVAFDNVSVTGILSAFSGAEQVLDSGERLRLNVDSRYGVLLVEVQVDTRVTDFQRKPVRTASWSLAAMRVPGRLSTEDMLTAIEAAVEVSGAADTAKIRFHDETSLLIVSARTDALETIGGVLEQLRRSSEESAREYQRLQQRRDRLADLEAQRRAVEQNIERLTLRLEEARKTNTPQADQQIMMLSGGIESSESQLNSITQEILRLQAELERPTQSP